MYVPVYNIYISPRLGMPNGKIFALTVMVPAFLAFDDCKAFEYVCELTSYIYIVK